MKADYFGDLLHSVPGVPGSEKRTGDGIKPHGSNVSPASPVSPVEKTTSCPTICQGCPALEILDVAGALLPGCVRSLPPASPWAEEWKPVPVGLTICPDKPLQTNGHELSPETNGGTCSPRLVIH